MVGAICQKAIQSQSKQWRAVNKIQQRVIAKYIPIDSLVYHSY